MKDMKDSSASPPAWKSKPLLKNTYTMGEGEIVETVSFSERKPGGKVVTKEVDLTQPAAKMREVFEKHVHAHPEGVYGGGSTASKAMWGCQILSYIALLCKDLYLYRLLWTDHKRH